MTCSSKAMPPVIILAGGKGTRLAPVVSDRPKVLAQINDKPFLDYQMSLLRGQCVSKVCFSLGFKAQMVIDYLPKFRSVFNTIDFVVEEDFLGTAGGVAHCLLNSSMFVGEPLSCQEIVVINGDSWVTADLMSFVGKARQVAAGVSLCAVRVDDVSRYGLLDIDVETSTVVSFNEKDPSKNGQSGWVNAGIYYFRGSALAKLASYNEGSLELDFFPSVALDGIYAYQCNADFVDIGTPESYQLAETIIKPVE